MMVSLALFLFYVLYAWLTTVSGASNLERRFIPRTIHGEWCNITGEYDLFERAYEDLLHNGGAHAPIWFWHPDNTDERPDIGMNFTDLSDTKAAQEPGDLRTIYDRRYDNMCKLVNQVLGGIHLAKVADALSSKDAYLEQFGGKHLVKRYTGWLEAHDHIDLLGGLAMEEWAIANDLNVADLGSVMDLLLLTHLLKYPEPYELRLIEVGGGYGRLAEVFLHLHDYVSEQMFSSVHILMIESVPAVLMYAYLYLRHNFPSLRIGCEYVGDKYSTDYHVFLLPPWRTDDIPSESFHAAINIESMQEMALWHVDFYLTLFDRVVKPSGLIYLSNSQVYIFKGPWRFPPHWEILIEEQTPRSWTPKHPTIIFEKGDRETAVGFSEDRNWKWANYSGAIWDSVPRQIRWTFKGVDRTQYAINIKQGDVFLEVADLFIHNAFGVCRGQTKPTVLKVVEVAAAMARRNDVLWENDQVLIEHAIYGQDSAVEFSDNAAAKTSHKPHSPRPLYEEGAAAAHEREAFTLPPPAGRLLSLVEEGGVYRGEGDVEGDISKVEEGGGVEGGIWGEDGGVSRVADDGVARGEEDVIARVEEFYQKLKAIQAVCHRTGTCDEAILKLLDNI